MRTPERHYETRVPITCTVCRKVVGYFPSNNLGRRKRLTTICEKCQTPRDAPHAPRDVMSS